MLVEDTTAFVERLEVSAETGRSKRLQRRVAAAELAVLRARRDVALASRFLGELEGAGGAAVGGRNERSLAKDVRLVGEHLRAKRAELAECQLRLDRLRRDAAANEARRDECIRLHSATHCQGLSGRQFATLSRAQLDEPVLVRTTGERQWWWYLDRFWWADEHVSASDVERLVLRSDLERKRASDASAEARASVVGVGARGRSARLPESVQLAVWSRDRGRCVDCGSRRDVAFDEIIARGDADPRNVELRCRACRTRRDRNEARARIDSARVDATPYQRYVA
jgi:hypothetical protein